MTRPFSEREFFDLLREKLGLERTANRTPLYEFWRLPNGRYVMVPTLDAVGHDHYDSWDYIRVRDQVKELKDLPPI